MTRTQIAPIRLAITAVIVMWASQEMDLPAVSVVRNSSSCSFTYYGTHIAIAVKR